MKKKISIAAAMGLFTGALLAVGCGGSDTGNSNNSSSSSSSFTCCLNGSFYECSSSDAVMACGRGDTSGCSRDSSKDSSCD